MRGSYQTTDNGDAAGLRGDLLGSLAIARDEGRAFDQIAGRVAADRQLGKQDQSGADRLRATGVVDDLGGVAGEISDRGIDLAERNLHIFSVKQEVGGRRSGCASEPRF